MLPFATYPSAFPVPVLSLLPTSHHQLRKRLCYVIPGLNFPVSLFPFFMRCGRTDKVEQGGQTSSLVGGCSILLLYSLALHLRIMSSHQELINEFIASNDASVQTKCVEGLTVLLTSNKLSLLDLIQSLQMYITSTNDSIRISTFTLLSSILSGLPSNKLFPQDIEVLLAFFYSKLADKPVVKHVLEAICSLVTMKYFNSENIDKLLMTMMNSYNPKENLQAVRYVPLKITNFILNNLTNFENDLFIKCFIHISQNEKDPNNLLLIFQLLNKISRTLNVENFINDLFDTMFRYYPISFKSSNDNQTSLISSLKDSLNDSLASNDLYAKELFPNLIDKYNSSTLVQVKLDILSTISKVSQIYSKSIIEENYLLVWNTIKYSIINQELIQMISLKKTLNYYESSSNESDQLFYQALITIRDFSKNVSNECKLLVFDDLKKNLIMSERNRKFLQSYLVLSLISDNDTTGEEEEEEELLILNKTFENLFSELQLLDQVKNKRTLLIALSYFTSNPKSILKLCKFRNEILNLLQSSLSASKLEITLQTLAIQLTSELILLPAIYVNSQENNLFNEENTILLHKLSDMLIENCLLEDNNKILETELLVSVYKISSASKFENILIDQVINYILISLNNPDTVLALKCTLLSYLVKIASTPSLIQLISIRIINLLGTDILPIDLLLQTLNSLINLLPLNFNSFSILKNFAPILLKFLFANNEQLDDYQILYISNIFKKLLVNLNNEQAEKVFYEFFNIFSETLDMGKVSLSDASTIPVYESTNLKNLPILYSLLQNLDLGIKINSDINVVELVEKTLNILSNCKLSELCKLQLKFGLTVLFNKYLTWNDFCNLSTILNNDLELKIYCLYGLIIKCDLNATEELINLLNSLTFKQATKAINIIFTEIKEFEDTDDNGAELDDEKIKEKVAATGLEINHSFLDVYKKERETLLMVRNNNKKSISNLILRNMWKQKILEVLLIRFNDDAKANEINYILPLILTYLPEDLYSIHLTKLLPNLINTLQSMDDSKILLSILKIICNILMNDSNRILIKPYINSIIDINLKIIQDESNWKSLRKQSLSVLLCVCLLDLSLVVPYKKQILKVSEFAIGDKNRAIRMAAVSVRQAWEDLGVDLSM